MTEPDDVVAVIADIHANLPALDPALARIDELGVHERRAAAKTNQALVFGHTHMPWVHNYGGVLFVNCGSVGKPEDGDPRGALAILRPGKRGVEVTIERVEYDAEAVAREGVAVGLPTEYANKLVLAA